MTTRFGQCWTAGAVLALTVAALTSTGCNMVAVASYLAMGAGPVEPPSCMKLVAPEGSPKGKEVRVVIFASIQAETRPEFLRIDREMAEQLGRRLRDYYKEKKEHVVIVPVSRVEKFKDEHPDWRGWEQTEIGKHFDADYVIDLDIRSISLFEKGSWNQMYHGKMEIQVGLLPMHKAADGRIEKIFTFEHPATIGSISTDDMPYDRFKQEFLEHASRRLAWYFIPHPAEDQLSLNRFDE